MVAGASRRLKFQRARLTGSRGRPGGGLPLVFEASGNTSFGRPVICRYFKGCSSVCELERYKDESWRALEIYIYIPSFAAIQRDICFPAPCASVLPRRRLCLHVSCPRVYERRSSTTTTTTTTTTTVKRNIGFAATGRPIDLPRLDTDLVS